MLPAFALALPMLLLLLLAAAAGTAAVRWPPVGGCGVLAPQPISYRARANTICTQDATILNELLQTHECGCWGVCVQGRGVRRGGWSLRARLSGLSVAGRA